MKQNAEQVVMEAQVSNVLFSNFYEHKKYGVIEVMDVNTNGTCLCKVPNHRYLTLLIKDLNKK